MKLLGRRVQSVSVSGLRNRQSSLRKSATETPCLFLKLLFYQWNYFTWTSWLQLRHITSIISAELFYMKFLSWATANELISFELLHLDFITWTISIEMLHSIFLTWTISPYPFTAYGTILHLNLNYFTYLFLNYFTKTTQLGLLLLNFFTSTSLILLINLM